MTLGVRYLDQVSIRPPLMSEGKGRWGNSVRRPRLQFRFRGPRSERSLRVLVSLDHFLELPAMVEDSGFANQPTVRRHSWFANWKRRPIVPKSVAASKSLTMRLETIPNQLQTIKASLKSMLGFWPWCSTRFDGSSPRK